VSSGVEGGVVSGSVGLGVWQWRTRVIGLGQRDFILSIDYEIKLSSLYCPHLLTCRPKVHSPAPGQSDIW
jgi:hypothetical protein